MIGKLINVKKKISINNLIALFIVFSILPFVLISFYIHPHYDDYDFINKLSGKNIFNCTWYWYNTWSGRYSSIFITNILTLGANNIKLYRLYPIVLIMLFNGALLLLFKQVFNSTISFGKLIIVSTFFFVVYLYKMPEVTTGFFYMVCAYVSSLGTIAFIALLAILLAILKEEKPIRKIFKTITGIILAIFIGGSYEPTMATAASFLSLLCLILIYKRDENWRYFLIITLVVIGFALLSVIAPGNKVRGGENLFSEEKISFIKIILFSIIRGVNLIINTLQNPLLLLSTIVFIPIANHIYNTNHVIKKYLNIHPVLPLIAIIVVPAVSFFPSVWSNHTPPRVSNQIYMFVLLCWFLFIQVCVVYLIERGVVLKVTKKFIFLIKILIILCLIPSLTNKNIGRAYSDLFTKASLYDQQLYNRYDLIKQLKKEKENNIEVPPLFNECSNYPLTIYYNFQELGTNPNETVNKIYARYWNVDSITIQNTDCIDFLNKSRVN